MHVNQSNTWSLSLFIESEFRIASRWEKIAVNKAWKKPLRYRRNTKFGLEWLLRSLKTQERGETKKDRPHRSTNGARAPIADACIAEAFYRGQQTTRQLFWNKSSAIAPTLILLPNFCVQVFDCRTRIESHLCSSSSSCCCLVAINSVRKPHL